MPDCRLPLINDPTNTYSYTLIGEMAHMVGKKPGAPRYDGSMSDADRNSYENLILLCPTCHVKIDKQVDAYAVEKL